MFSASTRNSGGIHRITWEFELDTLSFIIYIYCYGYRDTKTRNHTKYEVDSFNNYSSTAQTVLSFLQTLALGLRRHDIHGTNENITYIVSMALLLYSWGSTPPPPPPPPNLY